jgi:hypothetical protein
MVGWPKHRISLKPIAVVARAATTAAQVVPVGRGGGKNPFKQDTWNLTEQMKIAKSDPQLAARLKAAA